MSRAAFEVDHGPIGLRRARKALCPMIVLDDRDDEQWTFVMINGRVDRTHTADARAIR